LQGKKETGENKDKTVQTWVGSEQQKDFVDSVAYEVELYETLRRCWRDCVREDGLKKLGTNGHRYKRSAYE
jgi:hypothetical protein